MLNIALDGPAGSGKSTAAKLLAAELDMLYLDTGAMYRAIALKALRLGIDPNDAERVMPMLPETSVDVENRSGTQHTFLDGEDVSGLIRTQQVSKGASDIAVIPAVREKLVELQREIALKHDVIMDGRDIGSYVIPNTPYKFYINASVQERARRRLAELQERGEYLDVSQARMEEEIAARDHTDSTRAFAPLKRTEDAVYIDTTGISAQEVVRTILDIVKGKAGV